MALILITLFEPLNQIPSGLGLGPVGTIISLFFLVLLGILNVIQFRKRAEVVTAKGETEAARNEKSHWEGTATAYEKELSLVRERCKRLEDQSAQQVQLIGDLSAKTDLKPLMEIQERVVTALQELSIGSADRYMKAMDVIAQNTTAIGTLEKHMAREFAQNRKALKNVTTAFEKKMSGHKTS